MIIPTSQFQSSADSYGPLKPDQPRMGGGHWLESPFLAFISGSRGILRGSACQLQQLGYE